MDNIKLLKNELQLIRKQINTDSFKTAEFKIANNLREVLASHNFDGVLAVYINQGFELSLSNFIDDVKNKYQLVLPRFISTNMPLTFNKWGGEKLDSVDHMGVKCSNGKELKPTALVLPLLGFSKNGSFINSSEGIYETTVDKFEGLKIGIAFDECEKKDIISNNQAAKLNYIITPTQIIKI